jgi:carnitine O-acetyltransferase
LSKDQGLSDRTFGNEEMLPRVPLPKLEDSCARFLEWCAPLLTPDELAETRLTVESFLAEGSAAHVLQTALEKYNACESVHSWLDEFWPRRYLGRRDRIALNANFFFLLHDRERDQPARAAALTMAALHYKLLLDHERIPPVVQHGRALSMEQNKYLFATTRIPGPVQDTVRAPYSETEPAPSTARHILVFHRGHLVRMDVIGPDGRPHTLDELREGFQGVLGATADRVEPGTSAGPLTTGARAAWAANRAALVAADPINASVLDQIETALFCVCLEDLVPADDLEASNQLLHGDSSSRWFDKALSFIVFGDGTAGVNMEHCGLDGTTVLSFLDTLMATATDAHAAGAGAVSQGLPPSTPLRFVLDDRLRVEAGEAEAAFADYAAATATMTLSVPDFGSDRAKRRGMSPDAFVQLAYQLAHHRAKGFIGATYESIATRQWRRGRTEAMRVVTPEIVRFVSAMTDASADAATRRRAAREAAEAHVARAKACQAGAAPEQHLWELQLIAERQGEELGVTGELALYDSPGWRIMRDDYLSTSSAPSRNISFFGFGSTSGHCIGVGYVLLPDRLNLFLSTPRAVAGDMTRFAAEVRTALGELDQLLSDDATDA